MVTTLLKFAGRGCAISFFVAGALLAQQQHTFDGTWEMDAAQSKVNDGRVVTVTIATTDKGVAVSFKTHKRDGTDMPGSFISKLDGKPCEFVEGDHKSQLTAWYNGPTLNASKEGGPADDTSAMWKFELGDNKATMTLTINHYAPTAADEVLVFKKKGG
jgi:hypothetical protein